MSSVPASNIRAAASVLVLRDGTRGTEVLLMRRPERDNDFRSGACVFPGGVLDRGDAEAHALCVGLDDALASRRLGLTAGGLDYFIAALRECFEEVGLLFACRPDGAPVDFATHADELKAWRHRLHGGEATLPQLLQAFDWRLDLRETAYFAHWLTPVTRPKRFDTRFFVRLAPQDQQAVPDMGEALELMWLTPDEALDPQRGLKLLNVTQRVLHSLRGFANAREAFGHALALRGVARVFPRPAIGRDGARFIIESDPAYEEVAHLDPDGRGEMRCELVPGDVVQLSARLWRISGYAGNAYLVTDSARSEAALIDAMPDDPAQAGALQALATMPVRLRIFTQTNDAQATALPAQSPLRLGADCTLRVVAESEAGASVLLVEDGIVFGAATAGAEWHAPTQGFMRRTHPR